MPLSAHTLPPGSPARAADPVVQHLAAMLRVLDQIEKRLACVEESLTQKNAGVVVHNATLSDATQVVEACPKNELPTNKNRRVLVYATGPIVVSTASGTVNGGLRIPADTIQDLGHMPGDQALFATRQSGVNATVSVVAWEAT